MAFMAQATEQISAENLVYFTHKYSYSSIHWAMLLDEAKPHLMYDECFTVSYNVLRGQPVWVKHCLLADLHQGHLIAIFAMTNKS